MDIGGKEFRVDTDVDITSGRGVGANKRTLEYGGGGAGFGGLMGAILAEAKVRASAPPRVRVPDCSRRIFTRGKQVKVPSETTMRFRLDRTLVLKLRT